MEVNPTFKFFSTFKGEEMRGQVEPKNIRANKLTVTRSCMTYRSAACTSLK